MAVLVTGQEIVQRTPAQELVSRVRGDEFKQQIALALPEGTSVERFLRATVTALMANPDLAGQASHDSIFTALLRSAQDNLVPDGKEAALVVYSGKAQYLPMVGGLRKIAGEHGWALVTAVVKEGDVFDYELGLEPKLRHVPARPGVDRGPTIAAYCVASHPNGHRLVEVMLIDELEQIRATSKKPTSGPWKDWTDRMYEKTVGKRAFAKLPLGELDARVLRILEAAATEPAEASRLIYGPPRTETPAALPPAGTDAQLTERTTTSPPPPAEQSDVGVAQQATTAASPAVVAPGTDEEPSLEADEQKSAFAQPAGVGDDEITLAAKQAAMFKPPNGANQHLSLSEILAVGGKGEGWFRDRLDKVTEPAEYVQALWNFTRVYAPELFQACLLYTSPSPRDRQKSRMPSSA